MRRDSQQFLASLVEHRRIRNSSERICRFALAIISHETRMYFIHGTISLWSTPNVHALQMAHCG